MVSLPHCSSAFGVQGLAAPASVIFFLSNVGELTNLCKEKEPSIVILVETFLDSSVEDGADCIAIPGYFMCCRKDRTLTSGGGIAMYCLEGIAIHHNPLRDPDDLELMWLSVTLQSQKLRIGA